MINDLSYLPADEFVFIDSNIFTYHLNKHSRYFSRTLEIFNKVESGGLKAVVNCMVVSEVMLNFIKAKLSEKGICAPDKATVVLKENPKLLALINFNPVMQLFSLPNLSITSIATVKGLDEFAKKYSLLPNDALNALTCRNTGIKNIITNDSDYASIDFLAVWKP
ncbi:PIN domain-containing protein [archaeon]|nr:PIN domain-containing protein [archaeon]